ncbi:MAG: alpha/beta fold hydrolase [Planctomycetales bacterium]|nr:alpha/beta fold hydrolase [Planctomycetales bacterium]
MSRLYQISMLPAAISVITFLIGMAGFESRAEETGAKFSFKEHPVEFHNQDVRLAGSLLLPNSEAPVPAVVFVHGAGPQTREPYREVGEYFASQGIAALIYDKRGVGKSGGSYESYAPYENLVKDALAAVGLLKQRREIAPSQIGVWGLSQGAQINATAASRSEDIKFVIAVGASVADGTMFFYRDNLFRKFGLPNTLRDVAEKAQLGIDSLPYNMRDESLLASFAPRSYPPPDKYVDPAWSHVNQPVLVMWGQLDQHQPVGESMAGLKNSLAQANNENWTMIILPRAKHSLGISDTGAIQEKWRGYPPGALKTMTDWVHAVSADPSQLALMKQEGFAQETGVLANVERYERLRWYGNGTVQVALSILFLISFLASTIAGAWYGLTRLFRRRQRVGQCPDQEHSAAWPASDKVLSFKRAICALNLLILVGMTITVQLVIDQMHPSCPAVLMYLPLLGTVSTVATVALMIVLARTPRDHGWTAARRIRFSLEVLCLVLFVPYMFYWNLIGFRF